MPKHAISITLETGNLLWLKNQTAAAKRRSVSETLDALVTSARTSGMGTAVYARSVAGTIDIADDDPDLSSAKSYVTGMFDRSVRRPIVARESSPVNGAARKRKRNG